MHPTGAISAAKQAQAQRVLTQIAQLDSSLERARNLYMSATQKLQRIEHSLKINRIALRVSLGASRASIVWEIRGSDVMLNDDPAVPVNIARLGLFSRKSPNRDRLFYHFGDEGDLRLSQFREHRQ